MRLERHDTAGRAQQEVGFSSLAPHDDTGFRDTAFLLHKPELSGASRLDIHGMLVCDQAINYLIYHHEDLIPARSPATGNVKQANRIWE